jgi:AGCS family alanine or glycine:cation symporter
LAGNFNAAARRPDRRTSTMLDTIHKAIQWAVGYVWGWPTIVLLVGTGLYLTILLRGLQFRTFFHAFALIFSHDKESEGDISHFGALMTALAATVGNGNIVGVAAAISMGGPGAVFWMWMTGLVGMVTKYSEAVLAVKFRHQGPYGMRGGPMYYISEGARLPWLGWLFALFASIAAFGIGNMFQGQAVAGNFEQTFGIPQYQTGIVLTILTALVILGGIKTIASFSSFLVPVMIVGYCGAGLVVLGMNLERIPAAFGLIFKYAFTPHAAFGGTMGALLAQTIRSGVARGVFSNESGLGSSPIAAAAARTKDPSTQALVSMTQTFIDTLVVCTMTALVILTSTQWGPGADKNALTALAFSQSLGHSGKVIVALSSAVFAYSTLIGWCYYGEKSIEYIFGPRAIHPYRIMFVGAVMLGCIKTTTLNFIIDFSDLTNGLMAIPNLVGLLVLSMTIKRETDGYLARLKAERAKK